jgi:dihydropyrimidinase
MDDFSKIPNGGPAIEDRMSLLYHFGVVGGRITLQQFVNQTSTNAAKIFGMYPQKGTVAVGSDADLVVWDPAEKRIISAKTHKMNVDYSTYEGVEVQGVPKRTIVRGETVVLNGEYVGRANGIFIKRALDSMQHEILIQGEVQR